MARKLIMDTDPGVDDAMAIFLALASPELDIIGLTTIFGNVHTGLATTNALRLLEIAGRTDIPVAKGVEAPLARPFTGPVPFVHGEDGQGNTFLPPPQTKAIEKTAAVFIIEQVLAHPGEITLAPIGPLSNIALALRLEPSIADQVQEVVLMGGNAMVPGNASPAAEANILNDPEAADVVFGAAWPVTMVGLDVTHQVHMRPEQLARHRQATSRPMAQHLAAIVPFYQSFFETAYSASNLQGIYVHDASAIAYLIDPTLFEVKRWPIRVETEGIGRGKTWPAIPSSSDIGHQTPAPWKDRPLVNVCVGVDGARVVELELSRLT
jgi:inosine-uridine nucleoside N-ribohydrolase